MNSKPFQTQFLFNIESLVAPDESKIKELVATDAASMVHCTLSPGSISQAVRHKNVDFQFRNDGEIELVAIIVTIPPWPGNNEAITSKGPWDVRASQ